MIDIKDFQEMRKGTKKNTVYVKAVVIGGNVEFGVLESVAVGLIAADGRTVAFYADPEQIEIPGEEVQ